MCPHPTILFHEGKPPKRPETKWNAHKQSSHRFTRASRRSGLRRAERELDFGSARFTRASRRSGLRHGWTTVAQVWVRFHEGKPPKRPETTILRAFIASSRFTRASRRSGLRRLPCKPLISKSDFDRFDDSPKTSDLTMGRKVNRRVKIAQKRSQINRLPSRRGFLPFISRPSK